MPVARIVRHLGVTSFCAAAAACISFDGLSGGVRPGSDDGGGPTDAEPRVDDGSDGNDASADSSRAEIYRSAILADTPIAYWRFEETSGAAAKDEMAAFPGTFVLSPTLGRPGLFGSAGAIELPSSSSAHVEATGAALGFPGVAACTIEVWVKPAVFRDYQWIGGTETFPPRSGWSLFADAKGEVHYEVYRPEDGSVGAVRSIGTNRTLALGRFQHVVVTFNGQAMKTFIDGTSATVDDAPQAAPPASILRLGCRKSNAGDLVHCLDGWSLDEIALYDHPLTEEQVAAHYALGKP